MDLAELCQLAVGRGASDLILQEDALPVARVDGVVVRLTEERVTGGVLEELWQRCGQGPEVRNADAAVLLGDGARFRVNLLSQLGQRGAVLRVIRSQVPELGELDLPGALVKSWLSRSNGIVIVSGPTAAGKSTTLAAGLQFINQTQARHIITIEDPVEFVIASERGIVTQRDIGIDTPTFADGLRQALRQAPDVLMVGEIRDSASAVTALQAAETGRLVLATVHGGSCRDALERLSQLLPEDGRTMLGKVLASQLIGGISQLLLPGVDGGLVLAVEYFANAGVTRKYLEEGRFAELEEFVGRLDSDSGRSLMAAVVELVRAGRITEEVALAAVDNPAELTRTLRGISNQSARR